MSFLHKLVYYLVTYTLVFVFSLLYLTQFLLRLWKMRNLPSQPKIKEEPKCLKDPALGKHGFVELKNCNGIKIHYVANGSNSKPLLLLLHGFPEFWYTWKYQLKEFGKDYYAVAPDLPGYGDSDKPTDVTKYSTAELALNMKEFILELGYKSCILVGHDWGGGVAYRFATDFSEVVDKLIIMNCPHSGAMAKLIRTPSQLLKSGYMFFFQLPYIPEYVLSAGNCAVLDFMRKGPSACKNLSYFTEEDLDAYKYTFQKCGFTCPLNYYRMAFRSHKTKPVNKQLDMPSLIIWGTADTALGVELAELSVKYMNNGAVKYIDGASHWVNIEEAEQVNKYMREFLDG